MKHFCFGAFLFEPDCYPKEDVIKAELQQSFSTCVHFFQEITLVGSNQRNYFENANACSKRMLKTNVATQLKNILKIEKLKTKQKFILERYLNTSFTKNINK